VGRKTPNSIVAQSEILRQVLAELALFFKDPAQSPRPRKIGLVEHADSDWRALSRKLADCAEYAGKAAEEAARFQVPPSPDREKTARHLLSAAQALGQALEKADDLSLLAAKDGALEAAALCRGSRKKAMEEPLVPVELKTRAVVGRLAEAAEALQQACDLAAQLLFA
jgi:hypothetical protein